MQKILSLVIILALILTGSACAFESATSPYPVTVVDHAGRTVVIEETPQRIVSGYYISTSLLIALDLEDRIVGIEAKADKRPIYRLSAPELIELPSVGTAKEFDLEGCLSLEPDLVILPLKLKNTAETLESMGIDAICVNPENQQLLGSMMDMIAEATNTKSNVEALKAFNDAQKAYLTDTLAGSDAPTVYLAGNSDMLSTAGNAMYQSDMIRLAGGINAAAEIADAYWVTVSYEQLLSWNPDYIILASDAGYTVDDVLSDANLAACKAVTSRNVYQLPDKAEAWDSPVPGCILGSVWLANVLHPELFSKSECTAKIDEYYESFYNFIYSES